MAQSNIPLVAREVLWTYRGVSEEHLEKDFYTALETTVAAEIKLRLNGRTNVLVGRGMLLEGEVGSGKTALAPSIGHSLALSLQSALALFIVNAQVRGGGHVGELTQNISRAFTEAERCQEREQIPVMLLIDEADALAQARGSQQTHHEDDAGVNTLIQRIDRLRGRPMAVIFATNLFQSLDSAILRRAIASYHFIRPDDTQRANLFSRLLANIGLDEADIAELVRRTQPRELEGFG